MPRKTMADGITGKKAARKVAQLLKAERDWREATATDPNNPPPLRLETENALAELGVRLDVSEIFGLVLNGRTNAEIEQEARANGFTPVMPVVETDPMAQYEQELLEKLEAERIAKMSTTEQDLYLLHKSRRDAEAKAAKETADAQQIEARKPWIDYLESILETWRNDVCMCDEKMEKIVRTLIQVKTPGSDHEVCLSMLGECGVLEAQVRSEFSALLKSQIDTAAAELAEYLGEATMQVPADLQPKSDAVYEEEPYTDAELATNEAFVAAKARRAEAKRKCEAANAV